MFAALGASHDVYGTATCRAVETVCREWSEARLEELRPVFALVREWRGQGTPEEFREVIALRHEVDRLQGIVENLATRVRRTRAILRRLPRCGSS